MTTTEAETSVHSMVGGALAPPGLESLDFADLFSFGGSPSTQVPLEVTPEPSTKPVQPSNQEQPVTGVDGDNHLEPPDVAEMQSMREKLLAMGIVEVPTDGAGKVTITTGIDIGQRERELAEMVLRLTQPTLFPSPTQVIEQAATIASLTTEIEILTRRQQEERDFWEAERQSWYRIAEALTARRFVDGTHRADALERDNLNLMSTNNQLRNKLADQQNRLEALETELRMLRPVLLVGGVPGSSGPPISPPRPAPVSRPVGRPRKHKDPDSQTTPPFSDDELEVHHSSRRKGPKAAHYSAIADARSEHILLASRKLGRKRVASILPGAAFPEPWTLSSRGINSIPPPNGTPYFAIFPQTPGASTYPYGPTISPTRPTVTPRAPPVQHGSPERPRPTQPNAPTTPHRPTTVPNTSLSGLDDLINASRILNSVGRDSVDGSPLKRRRISGGMASPTPNGENRMKSALDVLAEQAAVVISQSPRKAPRSDIESEDDLDHAPPPPHTSKGKGKGKAKQLGIAEPSVIRETSHPRSDGAASSLKSPISMRPSPAPIAALHIPPLEEGESRSRSASAVLRRSKSIDQPRSASEVPTVLESSQG